jgi:sporulation protein YlmC with PRC-barrel domain
VAPNRRTRRRPSRPCDEQADATLAELQAWLAEHDTRVSAGYLWKRLRYLACQILWEPIISGDVCEPTPHAVSQITKEIFYMLKTLALAAVGLAFAGGLAFAESPMTREPTTGRSVVTSPSMNHWLASNIYKANVYDPSENKIGDVSDLIIDSDGNVTAAVISVGGFLGVGQKDVEIPFKDLKITMRDGKDWLTLNRTKDELKSAPAYDKKAENRM